jgi:hypothetical protein
MTAVVRMIALILSFCRLIGCKRIPGDSALSFCGLSLLFGLQMVCSGPCARTAEAEKPTNQVSKATAPKSLMAALPPAKWQQVESAVAGMDGDATGSRWSFSNISFRPTRGNESVHDGLVVARTPTRRWRVRARHDQGH